MTDDASRTGNSLVLSLPRDLASELLRRGEVAPFLRESRTDPTLVSAVVIAAATAGTTVLITNVTKAAATRIGDAIRRYFTDRGTSGTVELIVERDGTKQVERLTISTTLNRSDDIVRLLESGVRRTVDNTQRDDAE